MATLVAPPERSIKTLSPRPAPAPKAPLTSPARAPRRLGRRPVLDGIRGTAVLLVMLEHTGVLPNGFMGVDVFFALSGFLITTLLVEEFERRGRISLRGFYARRAKRLLPALWLVVGAAVIVNFTIMKMTGDSIGVKTAVSLSFTDNWFAALGHSSAMGALNPTWSLGEEEQFYLLWPIVLIFCLWRGVRPWGIIALLATTILGLLLLDPIVANATPGFSQYYSPIDRAPELLFGAAGALVWHHRLIPIPRGRWAAALVLVPVGVFVYMALYTKIPDQRFAYLTACGLALPALLLMIESPNGPLSRFFTLPPLRYLGKISYCVYLCHLLIRNVLLHYLPGLSVPMTLLLTLSISVAVGTASWYLIESRVNAWKPAGLRIRRPRSAAARTVLAGGEPAGARGALASEPAAA